MSLQLYYREEGTSVWTEIDLVAERVTDIKLAVSYAHAARLTWIMHQAQHTQPIPDRADIAFIDTDFGSDFDHPVFEGHVHEIQPSASNEVAYTAYDPTKRAGDEITILSGPSLFAAVIPRLVYNAKIEQDEDYAFERAHDATVGEMIEDMLSDAYTQLEARMAAPDADSAGGPAYNESELLTIDFQPQEKVVFETESLRSGIDRLLAYYPQYRLIFNPNPERIWHFRKVVVNPDDSSSSGGVELPGTVTLVLNDFTADKRILSLSLQRSLEQRYTAVEILGPPKLAQDVALVSEGSDCSSESSTGGFDDHCGLIEKWSAGDEYNFTVSGPGTHGTGNVSRVWQVANPVRRQLGRILPQAIVAPIGDQDPGPFAVLAQIVTRLPSLQATFDGGVTWRAVVGFTMDVNQGIVTAPYHVYTEDGSGDIVLPDDVKLVYPYYDQAIVARYPSTGFEGTAFDVAGVQNTFQRFDEDLVVGYEAFRLVTEEERKAEFEKLARNLHEAFRDIVYTGGCVLDGIDYEFLRLNKLINFAAVDGESSDVTTGWEDVQAILTDVEYDFSAKLTTLQFSSDHLEFTQQDPELLKQLLKIKALEPTPPGIRIVYSGPGFQARSSLIGFDQTVDFRENEGVRAE